MSPRAGAGDNSQISGSDYEVDLVELLYPGSKAGGEMSSGRGSKDLEGSWALRPGPSYPWNSILHSHSPEPSHFRVCSGSPSSRRPSWVPYPFVLHPVGPTA